MTVKVTRCFRRGFGDWREGTDFDMDPEESSIARLLSLTEDEKEHSIAPSEVVIYYAKDDTYFRYSLAPVPVVCPTCERPY